MREQSRGGPDAHPCRCEPLEPRLALSVVSWTGAGDGVSWHDGFNWDTGSMPGINDDAVIDVAAAPTIEFGLLAGDRTIRSLVSREAISFSAGSLSVLTTAEVSAEVWLNGGHLIGGAWDVTGGAMRATRNQTWLTDLAELTGDIDMAWRTGTKILVQGGLTHHGAILAYGATISFGGDQTYRSGTIDLSGSRLEVEGRVELASDVTVLLSGASNRFDDFDYHADETLVNLGTVEGVDTGLIIEIQRFENAGSLAIDNGDQLDVFAAEWDNSGAVSFTGAGAEIRAAWTNTGHIAIADADVVLTGSCRTADLAPERFERTGGSLTLHGSLDNTGASLSLTGSFEDMFIDDGRITGGTLHIQPGDELSVSGADFYGPMTVYGDVHVGGWYMTGGLSLWGAVSVRGVIRLEKDNGLNLAQGAPPDVDLVEVLPLASNVGIGFGDGATVGPDFTLILGSRSTTRLGGADLTFQGLVLGLTNSPKLTINGQSFTNDGSILLGNDSTLELFADTWTNRGTISALGSRAVHLGDDDAAWQNQGQITLRETELHLNGQLTFDTIGWDGFSLADTEVFLDGVLDNTGHTLVFGPETGVWTMYYGGGIRGGEVTFTPGYEPRFQSGRLEGPITVNGDISLQPQQSGLVVTGGLSLHGTIFIDDGTIDLEGSQTIESGNLVFRGEGGWVRAVRLGADPVINIGEGVSMRVESGATLHLWDHNSQDFAVINNHGLLSTDDPTGSVSITIREFHNAGRLEVRGPTTIDTSAWSSTGEIGLYGQDLQILGAVAKTSEINIGGIGGHDGVIVMSGTIDNTDDTLEIDPSRWRFEGGEIRGGIVNLTDTLVLGGDDDHTLAGPIEIHGDIRVESGTGVRLVVSGGMRLHGDLTLGAGGNVKFVGGQVIDAARIVFSGLGGVNGIDIDARDGDVTFGSDVHVSGGHQAGARITGYDLVNLGTISADVPGQTIDIRIQNFENRGSLSVGPGATLLLNRYITGAWSNSGTVGIDQGTLVLGGTFSSVGMNLQGFTRAGGTISLIGDLDNTGQVLQLTPELSPFVLDGGTITGGTIMLPEGHPLQVTDTYYAELVGPIEFFGDITTGTTPNAQFTISGGLNLHGAIILDRGALVYADGDQTIDSAEFRFLGNGEPAQLIISGGYDPLILGPQTRITGGHASGAMVISESWQQIEFRGVIEASTPGTMLYILPASFANHGRIIASNGAQVLVTPTGSYAGGQLLSGDWTVSGPSTLRLLGAAIVSIREDASVAIAGGQARFVGLSTALREVVGTLQLGDQTTLLLTPDAGTLVNSGTIRLGAGAELQITGGYRQTETGTLDTTVNGQVSRQPGALRTTGDADLAGALAVHYVDFVAEEGESLDLLLTGGGVTGGFGSVSLPDARPGDKVVLLTDPGRVRILNTDLADLNLDGLTTTQDFIAFLGLWSNGDSLADINGDGVIDSQDFIMYLGWWADG